MEQKMKKKKKTNLELILAVGKLVIEEYDPDQMYLSTKMLLTYVKYVQQLN